MDSPEVTFTLAYLVFAVCFVFTPTEFHSAGLTVQNLLSGWLGSEDAAFVPYHLRRTAATLLCHSLLPLGELAGRAAELGAGGGALEAHLPDPRGEETGERARAAEPRPWAKRPVRGGGCWSQLPLAGSRTLGERMLWSLGQVGSCHLGAAPRKGA